MATGSSPGTITPTHSPQKKRKIQQHSPHASASMPYSASTSANSTPTPTRKRRKDKNPHNRKLSRLESLPPEILSSIFLEDCNVALPRASPYLTRALRGDYVKRRYCEYILGHYRIYTGKDHFSVNTYCFLSEGDRHLRGTQNPFALRWMAWDYVRDAARRTLDQSKILVSECIEHGSIDRMGPGTSWIDPPTLPTGQAHRQWLKWAKPPNRRRGRKQRPDHRAYMELWYFGNFLIPPKLLRWPISAENLDFLDFLVQTGCQVEEPSKSLVGEIAAESAIKAIEAKDYRLVHRLLEHGIMAQPSLGEIGQALETIQWDPPMLHLVRCCSAIAKPGASVKLRARALAYHDGNQDIRDLPTGRDGVAATKRCWNGWPCPYGDGLLPSSVCLVCLRGLDKDKAQWHTLEECDAADEYLQAIHRRRYEGGELTVSSEGSDSSDASETSETSEASAASDPSETDGSSDSSETAESRNAGETIESSDSSETSGSNDSSGSSDSSEYSSEE